MPTVQIRCPQGISRLCELGETVARSGDWNRSDAREALIGLWLSCQLERAELRGTLEVVENRVQADVNDALVDADQRLLDAALNACWLRLDMDAKSEGITASDQVTIEVILPTDAGAIPLVSVVVVAAIIGTSLAVAWIGAEGVKGWWNRQILQLQTDTAAKESARGAAEAAAYQRDYMTEREKERAAGRDPGAVKLSPVAAVRLNAQVEKERVMASNITAPRVEPNKNPFDGLFSGENLAIGAAAVLGLIWLSRK